ncbi:hypothetical protein AXX12_02280 [Anaerosporomusa subterranea]|uniref:Uncharacterized protein n=1 Tax=Anaerosporomusa subterranea TaxID=1794912 RepID=A0A154BST6_ANASB|nr:hypothetical protein [Anaerosporomusa subterranea]KYZ76991.1 hypothetical protein AXX12_02280 [Anaerosporomusa subterranea]
MAWLFLLLSAAFLLLAVFIARSRGLEWKLRKAEAQLAKLAGKNVSAAERYQLLKTLFVLIAQKPDGADDKVAYKAIDLLQLAYGQGLARPDEPVSITALVGSLLSQGRSDLAAAVLDTYRGLLRDLGSAEMAAEQLQTVGVMAMKAKQSFVAAKAIDILFTVFEKPEKAADPKAVTAALGAVRVIGKFALKRGEQDFFRELVVRLRGFLVASPQPAVSAASLVAVFSLWMQVIVSKQDEVALPLLLDCAQELVDRKVIDKSIISGILSEWRDLAGIASLNPHSQMAAIIIKDMVKLAEKTQDAALWGSMVSAVMKTVRVVIDQYGTGYAFLLLYPLLDASRKMLGAQIRFPAETAVSDFRQHALFSVVKEFLAVAEFVARSRIAGTTYDVVEEFYHFWRDDQELNYKIKSAKKFFQLLILFWQKHMARQASKQMSPQPELLEPPVLTATDLERLGFMT